MAKNRNKKKAAKNGAVSMDVSTEVNEDAPQAMDTSEGKPSDPSIGALSRKIKKAARTSKSKNLRKLKAVQRAISKIDKSDQKLTKNKNKMLRVQSAKALYD